MDNAVVMTITVFSCTGNLIVHVLNTVEQDHVCADLRIEASRLTRLCAGTHAVFEKVPSPDLVDNPFNCQSFLVSNLGAEQPANQTTEQTTEQATTDQISDEL